MEIGIGKQVGNLLSQALYTHESFKMLQQGSIVLEDLPIDIVKGPVFYHLQHTLNPDSRFISACAIKANIIKSHKEGLERLCTVISVSTEYALELL